MSKGQNQGSPEQLKSDESVGFWSITWRNRRELLNWDLGLSLALAVGGRFAFQGTALSDTLPTLLIAEFGVAVALLGLVIAGLAIVASSISPRYAEVMAKTRDGPAGEFWAFWYVAVLAASSILTAGAALLTVEAYPRLTRIAFAITSFLTSYALLASVNLVGFIKAQGETRIRQIAAQAEWDRQHGRAPSA